jgi:methionine synthase II (cobalamin-independent)
MQAREYRITTTHVGSLPRNPVLSDLLIRQERGEAIDAATLRAAIADAVGSTVRRQIKAGVDIVSDGEQPRVGFQTYVPLRMKGFGGTSKRPDCIEGVSGGATELMRPFTDGYCMISGPMHNPRAGRHTSGGSSYRRSPVISPVKDWSRHSFAEPTNPSRLGLRDASRAP